MELKWTCKCFEDLSALELYRIIQLRNEIFVVEQNCVFQDADGKDQQSFHLMGWDNDNLLAYTRLLPPGLAYNEASIGRVATAFRHRREGLGKELMKRSICACKNLFGDTPIRIGAQLYLEKFYAGFGFVKSSDIYLEDGIQHIEMVLTSMDISKFPK